MNHAGAVSPRVSPSTRGVWLLAASGQRLRHTPGATRNTSGSSGITSFHITNSPSSGETISSAATTSAATSEPIRTPHHPRTEIPFGICV